MREDREVSTWSVRGVVVAALVGCIAMGAGAFAGYRVAHVEGQDEKADAGPPRPRPAGPAERALVAPLAEKGTLGGFEVQEIQAVNHEGVVRVVCVKGRAVVRLDVGLLAEEGPEPPAEAGRYAIFYSLKNATPEEGEQLARALGEVVKKNDAAGVAVPAGMVPFVPRKREPAPI